MKKKDRRHRHLATLLDQNATMRVGQLAEALAVTPETVRRDLDEMAQEGLVSRTYGGAVALRTAREPSLSERHQIFVKEREAIARLAVARLADVELLMIGSGATTTQIARRIAIEMSGITVITHSFGVATVLSLNPTISVLIVPGSYHSGEGATLGAQALRFLDNYQADYAIVGASGLTRQGASDALLEAGEVYSSMIQHSRSTMVVADHSKFDARFPACFAHWDQIDELISDEAPPMSLVKAIEQGGTQVQIVNHG